MNGITLEEHNEARLNMTRSISAWDFDGQVFTSPAGWPKRFVSVERMTDAVEAFQKYHHCTREQAVRRALAVCQWCYYEHDHAGYLRSYYV